MTSQHLAFYERNLIVKQQPNKKKTQLDTMKDSCCIPQTAEESAAKKELRAMIKNYLAEEMKKMKMSVEEQLKTTEDVLNKKLEVVEGATAKKGGKGSAKGKRK